MSPATAEVVAMLRPRPDTGLGRAWHVLDRRLNGFVLVAPFPCGFVQADLLSERTATTLPRLKGNRRACRLCVDGISRS